MASSLQTYSKKVDNTLVDPLRRTLVGRRLVPVLSPAGFGISSIEWSKITEMGDGMVSYAFTDTKDSIGATPTTSKIPVYWKDYTVDRRAYEGFAVSGINMDTSAAQSAAYVAAKAEDAAIIKGVANDGSNYDIDGLYEGAGNDYSVSSNFGTPGVATTAVAGAYALLADDSVPVGDQTPYNLLLNNTSYMDLMGVRSTNGVREMPEIKEMLNGGSVIGSSVLASTEGILMPTAETLSPYVDFFLSVDWKTEHGMDSEHPDTGDLSGRVYSAGILRIKHDVAICKLSALA